ncbi:TadE/TadG family type IV pilus assembly protein [Klebsiella sp. BIGb0407]|uniref:TadE/TadG family type IV pilus assembly protein n=1 Tax=Klebsiella sp. BIGb0407 TaxID=2940603 RepID=UPI0021680642|nr:hypothetical protein [Klebsiella sp. BIGb0407]MCS3430170.1 hypothetical protein [Klebsiella sp. BIGb0407]
MSKIKQFLRRERGITALETALAFPIILAVAGVFADLYTVSLERERMEQRVGAIASVLSYQSELTEKGLQGLQDSVMPDDANHSYQMLLSNVRQNGEVYWQLSRGNATDLCQGNTAINGMQWPGSLPERDAEKGSPNISMIVVEICRQGSDVSLLGGLTLSGLLDASTTNRVAAGVIKLDETLAQEAGLGENE